ncbi:hypothetical protein [Miniphocaeibacter halophilus]|uniref:Uncharacterized protein n=1 Tax=Miniphocaeibacter halophilus TaxID=2931922 RepID=A0AC61MR41_9FIRM|nr:hypothetical protein [Miniphocaeibacter halophilus]QQK06871.1 hypothetical protein JFY71_05850 [Miniphocaeibacter halophilus]
MKDEKLNYIVENSLGNIAQFVSFVNNKPNYIHINNHNNKNKTIKLLVEELLYSSKSHSVNIRSYREGSTKGHKLIYGLRIENIDEIINIIEKNSRENFVSIVNETIDVNDGGVSGVVMGNLIEFSPKDTPKAVEKEGVCSLPKEVGFYILEKVYGFKPEINFDENYRVEFSIHPNKEGVLKEHTIIWEYEKLQGSSTEKRIIWPNNFSKFLGDKVFGLLLLDSLGFDVPYATVVNRNVAPFYFGKKTGSFEKWIRTSPIEKEAGKYFTGKGWVDPFILMNEEEKKGKKDINIASLLSQDAVEGIYSGASIITKDESIVEGVKGQGDNFMVGRKSIEKLPTEILNKLEELNKKIRKYYSYLGDISIEWVCDNEKVWLVQMNQLKKYYGKDIIVEGNPRYYKKFYTSQGLESLRNEIENIKDKNIGIELIGNIGITSHFGDLLRQANIPSKIKRID